MQQLRDGIVEEAHRIESVMLAEVRVGLWYVERQEYFVLNICVNSPGSFKWTH